MALQQPPSAKPFLPQQFDLPAIREALPQCEGCELYQEATQVVCGEGSAEARMMIVGEQPGDQEDRTGRPFVGPAGEILAEALAAAQIPRDSLYVTNAVKHFHFEERGKRRIHKKPRAAHVAACRPWLEAEVAAVQPEVIVCLGATAALAILGREVRINAERGEWQTNRWDIPSLVTFHPAAILRAEGDLGKQQFDLLVDDLRKAWERLH